MMSAATGAGLGLLIGALAALPVTGLAAGGWLAHRRASQSQLARRVRQSNRAIEPGMSALFVLGETADAERLLARLQPYMVGANILRTAIPDDLLNNLESSAAVQHTTREAKERMGELAYALSAIQQELRLVRYNLTLDGEAVEVDGYTCMVANSGNVGLAGLPLLAQISVSDGLLDVVIVQNLNFLSLLRRPVSGDEEAERIKMVRHWQVREVTVAADPPESIIGDDEVWGATPFSARVLPGVMRVIVP